MNKKLSKSDVILNLFQNLPSVSRSYILAIEFKDS